MGSEVVEYAEENNIELLTHSDPEDMLAAVNAPEIMSSLFHDDLSRFDNSTSNNDAGDLHNDLPVVAAPNWRFQWLARYQCVVKCRGVIRSKGYIAKLGRDLRHLPSSVPQTNGLSS